VFGILIATGMRISEALTIKIGNINIEHRFIDTGLVKGARKSTLNSDEGLLFFIPEDFVTYIKNYLYLLDDKSKWLIPGAKEHLTTSAFYNTTKYNYPKKFARFHTFRRTLITNRVKKMGCPLWISEGLMNHAPSSVEGQSYIELELHEKRELYDKYFPYKNLPYF
jgi:integrase